MIQSNTTAAYKFGQSVGLECLITAFPMPSVTWTRNNVIIPLGEHYVAQQVVSGPTYYQLKSILVISSLIASDIGTYRCQVQDKLYNIAMQTKSLVIGKEI